MNLHSTFESKTLRRVLIALLAIISVLVVFQAGVVVGRHEAGFAYRFGDSYYRVFRSGEDRGMPMGSSFFNLPGGNGAFGKIIKVSLPTFLVEEPRGEEKVVLLNASTTIRSGEQIISSSTLAEDDYVVVIGNPNDSSQVVARFVRVLPPPPMR